MSSARKRLTDIANEMLDLIDAGSMFNLFDDDVGDMSAVDDRLREVMLGRQAFECIELAMYLRTSASRQKHLPTWQPLLNAAIELCRQRGENEVIFYGLTPDIEKPGRNTDDVTGQRHPQMQKR